jgi:glycosyltransferase involved in cell wall biosynthesis
VGAVPRVSVIIPAHDAAATVGAALDSVAAQSYPEWEIVVCDDGSSDATADVAAAHPAAPRLVRHERAHGPAAARNAALEQAGGELVALLDADDAWLPAYLERQVARYDAEGSRVGIVACDARVRRAGADAPHTYLEQCEREQHLPVEPLSLERVLRRNCIYVSALISREAGDEAGWFDEELFGTEDHDLWIRILERGWRAVLNRDVLAVYDRAPASVSSNLARMGRNNQLTYERALARGRLDPAERRVAERELRYNRALEAVAGVAAGKRPRWRALGGALVVAATRREHWGDWIRALRSA